MQLNAAGGKKMNLQKNAWSVSEVSQSYGISERKIRSEMNIGNLAFTRIGRRVVVTQAQLDEYLNRSAVSKQPPAQKVRSFLNANWFPIHQTSHWRSHRDTEKQQALIFTEWEAAFELSDVLGGEEDYFLGESLLQSFHVKGIAPEHTLIDGRAYYTLEAIVQWRSLVEAGELNSSSPPRSKRWIQ